MPAFAIGLYNIRDGLVRATPCHAGRGVRPGAALATRHRVVRRAMSKRAERPGVREGYDRWAEM